ncbi:MAG: DUF5623 domain-containing protein [Pseudohongiella sp.]|nr:DUF5623 domain-containing protein [Pseudohongiella sp.]
MSSEAIRPSSLDGIKRLAKSIKLERGVQHAGALDYAAQAAGFQNFRHADNVLRTVPKQERPRPGYRIFLTSYWKERKGSASGRETLAISLSAPWSDLITSQQLQNQRALADFCAEGPDHLARKHLLSSQSEARSAVCAAARALNFMDATKLRPTKSYSRAFPAGSSKDPIPGRDHCSTWYDRETKRYLFVDEPYESAVASKAPERDAWAKRHGYTIIKAQWAGMYAPDIGSRLYLLADEAKGIPLAPIAASLDKLPPPIVESAWNGESAPMQPFFVSPGAIAKAEATKHKPKPPRKSNGQRNSVGYIQAFVGPQRRPKGRMPIEAHAEVGRLLKSVLAETYHRKGVYNRINAIRSELDEWTQCEYNHAELPNDRFFELYYRESDATYARSLNEAERSGHQASLLEAKTILISHYPDCSPLNSLLKKIDAAVKSLQMWGS